MVKSSMTITGCYKDRFKESYRDVVEQIQRFFRDPSSPDSHDLLFNAMSHDQRWSAENVT